MTTAAAPSPRVYAAALVAMFLLPVCGPATPLEERDLAVLQAEAKKSFDKETKPFLEAYCTSCHGSRRMKGGINFALAIKNPALSQPLG